MVPTTQRWTLALAAICALAGCSREGADSEMAADSTAQAAEPVVATATWDLRFDDPAADAGGFQMAEQPGGGWTVKTGPAGSAITWKSQDMVEGGAFQAAASFEERSAPADHRESYGLIFGGRNLQAPDHTYTYFLVRASGDYLIKRREGANTPTLVDWTASDAIQKVVNEGDVTQNRLEVRVRPDSTAFVVNGTHVKMLPTDQVQPYGIAGLRVNHMLDMVVTGFEVQGGYRQSTEPMTDSAGAPLKR